MKLGMNMQLWTLSISEAHDALFEEIAKAGYDGVEMPVGDGSPDHFAGIRARLDGMGLATTAIVAGGPGQDPISPDPAVRAAALEHLKRAIDNAVALGAPVMGGPFHSAYANFVGRGPTEDEKGWSADVLRAAAEHAEGAGIRIAIEVLNRFECYLVNTTAQAMEIVERADHPCLGVHYDTHHAHIEEQGVAAAIRRCGDKLFHVHVSENDRGVPGRGLVDFATTYATLRELGYDGWTTVESFSRTDPEFAGLIKIHRDFCDDPMEVVREGHDFLRPFVAGG